MNRLPQRPRGVRLSTRTPRDPAASFDESNGWTRSRWIGIVAGIFGVQVAVLLLIGIRPQPAKQPPPPASRVTWVSNTGFSAETTPSLALADPADFALVGPRAFSSQNWFRPARPDRRSNEWTEPPRFLASGRDNAADPAPLFALPRSFFGLREPPEPATLPVASGPFVATNSSVRVEGLPTGRTARWAASPPVWEHPDVLQPSLVQVTVGEEGGVLTATLLASSGLAAADQKALELARGVVFGPLPEPEGSRADWARLRFDWRTIPPAAAPPR